MHTLAVAVKLNKHLASRFKTENSQLLEADAGVEPGRSSSVADRVHNTLARVQLTSPSCSLIPSSNIPGHLALSMDCS